MKKILIVLVCILVTTLVFGGGEQESSGAEGEVAKQTMTFPEATGEDHAIFQYADHFAKYVEEETNEDISVDTVPGGLFGTYESMLEQVQQGAIDFCIIGSSISGDVVPQVMITLLPFVYQSEDEVKYIADNEEIMGVVEDAFYEKGIKIVSWGFPSLRNILTIDKPIRDLGDFEGLRIRAPGRPILLGMAAVGADPVPMPFEEIHTAMQTGMIDAVERNTFVMKAEGWEKTIDYLNMDGHSGDALAIAMNREKWESLPAEQQAAIEKAGKRAADWAWEYNVEANKEIVEFYADNGIETITYTDEQKKEFAEAAASARETLAGEIGEDLVNRTMELLEEYRSR